MVSIAARRMRSACATIDPDAMIPVPELMAFLGDHESFRVERTVSTNNTDKFCEAICAFSNDLAASRLPGYLLIGADDKTGAPSGLVVTDRLLADLAALGTNGNILPAPAITVDRVALPNGGGDIAVVRVQPSDLPPVRYKGRTWIRRGPAKGIANQTEEALLTERRTAAARTFDAQPCPGANLSDLALDLFTTVYRPQAIDAETIAENHRPLEVQLASLRFFDLTRNCPTFAGLLLFGQDVLNWLPNAYVQYVRFQGTGLDSDVASEKMFQGDLLNLLRDLDSYIPLITDTRPVSVSPLRETLVADYPKIAVREFLLNAILHRSYEAPQPVRFYHFSDRMEIQNPGPLYGLARRDNFPDQTSYRNPILAEALKTLGFVNRFGRGVKRAQTALEANGSPPAEFIFSELHFGVTVRARP